MNTDPKERRRYPRFDLEYTTQLISPSGDMVITALTTNLSDGGLRIALPSDCLPECGKEMQVHLTVRRPDHQSAEKHTGYGMVVRHLVEDSDGIAEIAIAFSDPMNLHLQEKRLTSVE